MILPQIPCLKTLKNEIQRYADSNRKCSFFISFYDCPQDLSKKIVD